MPITRRHWLRSITGLLAAAAPGKWSPTQASEPVAYRGIGLPVVGRVVRRPSRRIAASPLSVGFETLDRKMFDPERTYGPLAELGVKWARVQTGWARCEQKPGQYDFSWLDAVVDQLRAIGVQPWFNLGYGNRLYMPQAPDASAVGWIPLQDDQTRTAWEAFVTALARHYRGRVRHWEIWNEPNIKTFWKPSTPAPGDYVRLVRITAPLIRQAIPDAVLIGGALAGMPTEFFKGCLEQGLGRWVQKISYHPYRPVPEENYSREIAQWRSLLAKYQVSAALWQGENGCPSQDGSAGALGKFHWTELRQAKWLVRRIVTDLCCDVELTSYFHIVDLVNYNWGSGPSGKTNFKGLLRGTDYSPKPAYHAYQCLCGLFDAETRKADEELVFAPGPNGEQVDRSELRGAAFVRRGLALYVYWHPAPANQERPLGTTGIRVPVASKARLSTPVLIDPLAQTLHRPEAYEKTATHWRFPSLPLADYPLILTDHEINT